MDDTPEHIKKLHKEIWMSKPPEERERQTIKNNEELLMLINKLRKGVGAPPVESLLPSTYDW
jgi:hypothetical protein